MLFRRLAIATLVSCSILIAYCTLAGRDVSGVHLDELAGDGGCSPDSPIAAGADIRLAFQHPGPASAIRARSSDPDVIAVPEGPPEEYLGSPSSHYYWIRAGRPGTARIEIAEGGEVVDELELRVEPIDGFDWRVVRDGQEETPGSGLHLVEGETAEIAILYLGPAGERLHGLGAQEVSFEGREISSGASRGCCAFPRFDLGTGGRRRTLLVEGEEAGRTAVEVRGPTGSEARLSIPIEVHEHPCPPSPGPFEIEGPWINEGDRSGYHDPATARVAAGSTILLAGSYPGPRRRLEVRIEPGDVLRRADGFGEGWPRQSHRGCKIDFDFPLEAAREGRARIRVSQGERSLAEIDLVVRRVDRVELGLVTQERAAPVVEACVGGWEALTPLAFDDEGHRLYGAGAFEFALEPTESAPVFEIEPYLTVSGPGSPTRSVKVTVRREGRAALIVRTRDGSVWSRFALLAKP